MNVASPAKKKIDSIVLGDGTFEALMKERAKQRKEKEEQSLAQIKVQLTAAERALTAETQRRIQTTHALQMSCTQKIQEMEAHFERILHERSLRMEERLATVQQKMEELTLRFEEEKDRVPKEMESRGKELLEMMEEFKSELAQERSDRLSREGRILKQMDDHAKYITEAIEKETILREETSKELMERITENEQSRAQSEYELQARVQKEMEELRDMIEKESMERKGDDDLILASLKDYAKQVENSLYLLNT
ncbi:hypothetical protein HJC23_004804 [Cyclotella cryptica]|uniref:SF-assemblin n=1 Tax=Cyclotella cryptica TaxID=29204 RepID=A0ABD3PXL1_9STRA